MGRAVRQGCSLSPILFNIYSEDLMSTGGVNVVGRRIRCIRFADDTALLAEDEMMLKNMPIVLHDKCEDYGMKII